MRLWRWLFCKHPRAVWHRNIWGDEIFHSGGKRSLWNCPDCGRLVARDRLAGPEYEHAEVIERGEP